MKTEVIRMRVEPRHAERLKELAAMTGLNESEVMRRLIENSDVAPMPMPVSKLIETCAADSTGKIAA
jgi:hypothetical protein